MCTNSFFKRFLPYLEAIFLFFFFNESAYPICILNKESKIVRRTVFKKIFIRNYALLFSFIRDHYCFQNLLCCTYKRHASQVDWLRSLQRYANFLSNYKLLVAVISFNVFITYTKNNFSIFRNHFRFLRL